MGARNDVVSTDLRLVLYGFLVVAGRRTGFLGILGRDVIVIVEGLGARYGAYGNKGTGLRLGSGYPKCGDSKWWIGVAGIVTWDSSWKNKSQI